MRGTGFEEIEQGIESLAGADLGLLDVKGLRSFVTRLEQLRTRLDAVALSTVNIFDERGGWIEHGAYNAANWLTSTTGTAKAVAGARVRLASRLASMPLAAEAFAAGEITEAHCRVLARCLGPRTRALFAEHEEMLVEQACNLTADDLATVVAYWLERADPDGPEPRVCEDNDLKVSEVTGGVKVDGFFRTEEGAVFVAALNEKFDELRERDKQRREIDPTDPSLDRPVGNRKAEALLELVDLGAASPESTSARKPSVSLLLDAKTARDEDAGADAIHELVNGTVIPLSVVDLWLCDCDVSRIIMSADGVPLELGREERFANRAQRRALAARDRGCAVPGCDRPVHHCDAHHVIWWRQGGLTNLDNLVLLCRYHHRRVHHRKLHVEIVDGLPRFTLNDGTALPGPWTRGHPPPQADAA